MCGVLTLFSKSKESAELVRLGDEMVIPLRESRGPDAGAVQSVASNEGALVFAHARLSIIDLNPRSNQPMHDPGSEITLTYNGEIYNYLQLKRELEGFHDFITTSDSEVLLAALKVWGLEKTLSKLKGMFAFCAYNKKTNELWAARDRAGEKPFSYGKIGDDWVFTSDLRVLRKHPKWQREISSEKIKMYLRYRFVPSPDSIYDGFYKLRPGHYFKCQLSNLDSLEPKPYWSIWQEFAKSTSEREVLPVLESTVKRFVNASDVPLGAFLSGGLDSSLVTALAVKNSEKPIQAFTIQFHEKGFDESLQATAVAKALGIKHWVVPFGFDEFKKTFAHSLDYLDEPFAVHSYFPLNYLSQFAREHVKVCLSGDGGDELFAGYNRHLFWHRFGRRFSQWPQTFRLSLTNLMDNKLAKKAFIQAMEWVSTKQPEDKFEKIKKTIGAPDLLQYYRQLIGQSAIEGVADPIYLSEIRNNPDRQSVEKLMALDFAYYLHNDVLNKVDRASMAHGLEARAPLLDLDIIQLAMQIPLEQKITNGKGKKPLYETLSEVLPGVSFDQPKSGFTTPVGHWVKELMNEDFFDQLEVSGIKSFLSPSYFEKLGQGHFNGESDFTMYFLISWLNHNKVKVIQ